VETLIEVFAALERAQFPQHPQLVVLRNLQSIALGALQSFMRYHRNVSIYLHSITKEAVVRPQGVAGVFAEGFYKTVKHPAHGRVFTELSAACAWLGITDEPWLQAVIAEERASLLVEEKSVELLHSLWPHGWMRVSLNDAAAQLGLPTRTLQRRLKNAGQSFAEARLNAALSHAEELLMRGSEVKVVAIDLGFASSSAFAAAFRRSRGLPPQEWALSMRKR